MHIGVTMSFSQHTSVEFLVDAVRLVEESGFHSVWVPEHVLFFSDYGSTYPYSATGRIPGEPDGLLDPFSTLTFMAAHTKRIRLGTGICLVPQRQPVYTAKMVADLDYLSSGRVDFGVGVGWLKEEFANLQVPWEGRGKRCEEYLDVMKALWSPGESSYSGDTYELAPCHFNPKPVQSPHPPIIFGGESKAALARVASHGNGWYGFDLTPADLPAKLAALDGALDGAGRSRESCQVFVGSNTRPVNDETVAGYREQGVDQLIVPLFGRTLEKLSQRAESLRSYID